MRVAPAGRGVSSLSGCVSVWAVWAADGARHKRPDDQLSAAHAEPEKAIPNKTTKGLQTNKRVKICPCVLLPAVIILLTNNRA